MNLILTGLFIWGAWVVMPFPCFAAPVVVSTPAELEPLTLSEALADYHASGELETFQCVHVPVGKNNQTGAIPLAVEFDDRIYLRIDGKLLAVDRSSTFDRHSSYSSKTTQVDVFVLKTTNTKEFGESSNRLMLLKATNAGRAFSVETFGAACGI
ncbi:hypothetical protein ACIPK7_15880 [Pseudomonas sp. NPDC086581]|uniref:hypothetical protein n=1 Tax=Pseudomonas sp. NPDC086581 TaxID=3364432 RepID=UPI003802D068